jgi:transcriptional regulator with XRE-family HTH domain
MAKTEKPPSVAQKLDALGEEAIIGQIANGKTQDEICEAAGVSAGSLNGWLHATPERSARARDAMETSAEAWLDRGFNALRDAPPDNAEIARARAIEQHCARRAAIRNPRFGDKHQVEHVGPGGGAIKTESTMTITAEEAYKRMLNGS